uniref:Uncharacterized protein n=1 Tax=Panagrolaimus davidi TaxID=227884 RepID=A0A914PID8_9BILA
MKFLPRTLSIDDVMKLVDTEEGDILLLTELTRDESVNSVKTTSSTNTDDLIISKSFDANFNNPSTFIDRKSATLPTVFQPRHLPTICTTAPESPRGNNNNSGNDAIISLPRIRPSIITLQELEAQEEEEDRVLLGSTSDLDSSAVHFRSRLSLIPEQHSVIDEDTEHSAMESESDISSKKSDSKRSVIDHTKDFKAAEEKQSKATNIPSTSSFFGFQ